MVLETELCVIAKFSGKYIFSPKIGKIDQKWAESGVFEFIEIFGH